MRIVFESITRFTPDFKGALDKSMIELQYSPYVVPLMISALVAAVLAWTAWRRRPGSGVIPFIMLMGALVIWTLAQAMEFIFVDFNLKVLALNLEYVGITMVPAGWLAFVLQYTGRNQWLTRRRVAALFIEPILVLLLS